MTSKINEDLNTLDWFSDINPYLIAVNVSWLGWQDFSGVTLVAGPLKSETNPSNVYTAD